MKKKFEAIVLQLNSVETLFHEAWTFQMKKIFLHLGEVRCLQRPLY